MRGLRCVGGERIVVPCTFSVNRSQPVTAEWRYDTADPLLVSIFFVNKRRKKKDNEWFFLREMLSAAMLEPVGDGDVYMESDGYSFLLELSTPLGACELICLTSTVQEFLNSTFNLVRQCYSNDVLGGPVRLCNDPECVECRAVRDEIDAMHEEGYI